MQSNLAELIKRSQLIVWDEAPMAHKHIFEAVDRCLRDIQKKDVPFGGKTVVLAVDFRLTETARLLSIHFLLIKVKF